MSFHWSSHPSSPLGAVCFAMIGADVRPVVSKSGASLAEEIGLESGKVVPAAAMLDADTLLGFCFIGLAIEKIDNNDFVIMCIRPHMTRDCADRGHTFGSVLTPVLSRYFF